MAFKSLLPLAALTLLVGRQEERRKLSAEVLA